MKTFLLKTVPVLAMFIASVFFLNSGSNNLAADGSFSAEIVNAHNRYRTELNIPGLAWSDELAAHAKKWADHLASLGGGTIMHASAAERGNEGENIWSGTAGYYSLTQMVDGWGDEKQYFRYGTFPDVSTSGNWSDVGHYTQIIWKDTKMVGCGKSSSGGYDILVCRYSPPGNYMRRKPY